MSDQTAPGAPLPDLPTPQRPEDAQVKAGFDPQPDPPVRIGDTVSESLLLPAVQKVRTV